jgi:hypothetical protein
VGALNFPSASPIVIVPRAARRSLRVPAPRSAAAVAATTLAFGIFVGVIVGPSLSGTGIASAPVTVSLPSSANASNGGGGGGGGASAGATLGSPVANKPTQTAAVPAPTAAVPIPPPVAPPAAPAAPVTPTTTPTTPQNTNPSGGGGGGDTLPPGGASIDGTVVHLNPVAGSYAVATPTGQLFAVHPDPSAKKDATANKAANANPDPSANPDPQPNKTVKLPKVGTVISAPTKELFNGTFAENGKRTESGKGTSAKFSGYVTYVDSVNKAYTVSVKGVSVLIHAPSGTTLPAVNDYVTVSVLIKAGIPSTNTPPPLPTGCEGPAHPTTPQKPDTSLVQKKLTVSTPSTFLYYEATVEGVCADTGQLVISADDASESMTTLTLPVAEGIDLSKVEPGTELTSDAEVGTDGTTTISGLTSDAGLKGADDGSTAQGDMASKAKHR